jgi:aldehyde dehydrogenase family protein/GFO/IDH/MocA oxidoreductase family protein
MVDRRVRWGLLGTARINERLIPAFRESERSELHAVASRSRARADEYAKQWQIPRAHDSYEALLADPDIDAVYISLPNGFHAEWTVKCADAGKHVLPDADIQSAAQATSLGGYINAGQVCISTQRVVVHRKVYADFLDALKPPVEAIKVGDPLAEDTRLSAMVSEKEAQRVEAWVSEAVSSGARIVTGGQRQGAMYAPTIVADVQPQMRISCEELFGPAVAVTPVDSVDEAIALANDSRYGLGSGIFTRDLNTALRFARQAQTGSVMINWTPLWRADLMPYGGFKNSGIGKEGPHYAVEEMTEIKTVVIHGIDG